MKKQCEINPEITITKGEYDISLFYIDKSHIAVSQLSIMDKESAIGYLSLSKKKDLKKQVIELLDDVENVYFFNRLNVPLSMRGSGLGSKLLQSTLNFMNEQNGLIINTANNYGDMGQKKLIDFYERNGFILLDKDGLLVYNKNLEKQEPKNKNKLI